jgi:hypothetical protein
MLRRLTIALLAATICLPIAVAQLRGGAGRAGFGSRGGAARGHRHFPGEGFLDSPLFYPDYEPSEPYAEEEPPPPLMMAPPSDTPRRAKPSPLLIEWRGDRYVRYGGAQETDQHGNPTHPDYAESATTTTKVPAAPVSSTHAVLVYRDGHRQDISDYAIADGVIYVQGTYWQNSSKTKPIPLSALDPVATMQANQQRGVNFILPSASNVVIASF